jgi:type III pantothenate kinase
MVTNGILLLDIGNTRVKAVLWLNGELHAIPCFPAVLVSKPTAVYFASVASDERLLALQAESQLTDIRWQQIRSETQKDQLRNSYAMPATLGVDRWLAMLGAQQCFPATELLVVDAGTALTIDHVAADGQHQGGWIVPGIHMQQKAVTNYTARVFNGAQQPFQLSFAKDTASCLQNGVFAAILAVIKQAHQLVPQAKMLITGGDAPALMPFLDDLPIEIEPLLIFKGMTRYIDN